MPKKLTYTLKEAAAAAGMSYPTMLKFSREPDFPGFRKGRVHVIPQDLFAEWLRRKATRDDR